MIQKHQSIFKEKIAGEEAYWISPTGKLLPMSKMDRHIAEVIKNPKAFGYTIEEIQAIYDKYGETMGSGMEGKAREEILLALVKQGWTRIRKYTRPDRWTVNVNRLNNRVKDTLQFWASRMLELGHGRYSDVYIDLPMGRKHYTIEDIKNDVLYMTENKKRDKRYKIKVIKSVFDF